MVKCYYFIIGKMIEKKLKPNNSECVESSMYKVLYIQIDYDTYDKNVTDDLNSYISSAEDFHIGYISKNDYEKLNELQLVKGFFDGRGKIKILG